MRLIDADALKEAINAFYDKLFVGCVSSDLIAYASGVDGIIDNAPTVEYPFYQEAYQTGYEEGKYERPQGEWITKHKENSFGQDVVCFECNKCGEYKLPIIHTMITEPLRVCPNCGVNMRKGGADNDEKRGY